MWSNEIRKTALRSAEMHQRYSTAEKDPTFFETSASIQDLYAWRIIENHFPYDVIATEHHMLIPRRKVASHTELTLQELDELNRFIGQNQYYDAILLNFAKAQSQPHWLHYHLLVFKTL